MKTAMSFQIRPASLGSKMPNLFFPLFVVVVVVVQGMDSNLLTVLPLMISPHGSFAHRV